MERYWVGIGFYDQKSRKFFFGPTFVTGFVTFDQHSLILQTSPETNIGFIFPRRYRKPRKFVLPYSDIDSYEQSSYMDISINHHNQSCPSFLIIEGKTKEIAQELQRYGIKSLPVGGARKVATRPWLIVVYVLLSIAVGCWAIARLT